MNNNPMSVKDLKEWLSTVPDSADYTTIVVEASPHGSDNYMIKPVSIYGIAALEPVLAEKVRIKNI